MHSKTRSKPGRNRDAEQLVIHANPEWTAEHWEHDSDEVARMMLAEFWKVSGIPAKRNKHLQSHRWEYAIPIDQPSVHCFADESAIIYACGDWASGARVEGAFLSGMAAAERILGTLSPFTP